MVLTGILAQTSEERFELTGSELVKELERIDISYIDAIDNDWLSFESFAATLGWEVLFRGREMGYTPIWEFNRSKIN